MYKRRALSDRDCRAPSEVCLNSDLIKLNNNLFSNLPLSRAAIDWCLTGCQIIGWRRTDDKDVQDWAIDREDGLHQWRQILWTLGQRRSEPTTRTNCISLQEVNSPLSNSLRHLLSIIIYFRNYIPAFSHFFPPSSTRETRLESAETKNLCHVVQFLLYNKLQINRVLFCYNWTFLS